MTEKRLALLLAASIFLSLSVQAQDGWLLDKDADGILVYTKEHEASKYRSFKAVVTVRASIEDIVDVLKDADRYTDWYGYTKSSVSLTRSGNEQFNYVETNFPWPFKNRDMVYRMTVDTSDTRGTLIRLTGLPDYVPEKRGIVRMSQAEGYILLEPDAGKTRVTYVFHSDPGGGVPAKLANRSISELPFTTLRGLRRELARRYSRPFGGP